MTWTLPLICATWEAKQPLIINVFIEESCDSMFDERGKEFS